MAEFSMNTQCFDPSETFKFRFTWDGTYVAGIRKVSSLKRTTGVVEHANTAIPAAAARWPAGQNTMPSRSSEVCPTIGSSRNGRIKS